MDFEVARCRPMITEDFMAHLSTAISERLPLPRALKVSARPGPAVLLKSCVQMQSMSCLWLTCCACFRLCTLNVLRV